MKVRFSLATIAFDRDPAQMSQILSSQGKNAPSNPYPQYLVRLATSRFIWRPEKLGGNFGPQKKILGCHPDPRLGPILGPSRSHPGSEVVPSRFAMCFVLQCFGPIQVPRWGPSRPVLVPSCSRAFLTESGLDGQKQTSWPLPIRGPNSEVLPSANANCSLSCQWPNVTMQAEGER